MWATWLLLLHITPLLIGWYAPESCPKPTTTGGMTCTPEQQTLVLATRRFQEDIITGRHAVSRCRDLLISYFWK